MAHRAKAALLMLVVAAAVGCRADAAPSNELEKIDPALARVQREVWEAWFAGDTTRLKEIVGDDLVAISGGGGGLSSLRDEVKASSGFRGAGGKLVALRFPEMKVQQFGDVVIVYSKYELTLAMRTDTTRQAGRVTEVFVRREGRWLNPAWHMDEVK